MTVFFDKALTKNISQDWFVSKKIKNNPIYLIEQYLELEKQEHIAEKELFEINMKNPPRFLFIVPVIFFFIFISTHLVFLKAILFSLLATLSIGCFMIISEFYLMNFLSNFLSPTARKIKKTLTKIKLEKSCLEEQITDYFLNEENKSFAYDFLQQGLEHLEEKKKNYGAAFSRYLHDNYYYDELKTDFLTALNEQHGQSLWFEIRNFIDLETDLADIYEDFLENQEDILNTLKIEDEFDTYCIEHSKIHFEKEAEISH